MSQLIDFYRGSGTDAAGRTLAEVWEYSDDELESVHDFIQWLFPLRGPSQFNPDAPLLTEADCAEFRSDPDLQANLLRSFAVFLAFLGLRTEAEGVTQAPDFDRKQAVWRFPNHNWLRITRVLTSTRLLGLGDHSRALFDWLKAYRESGRSGITANSFGYWERAAGG